MNDRCVSTCFITLAYVAVLIISEFYAHGLTLSRCGTGKLGFMSGEGICAATLTSVFPWCFCVSQGFGISLENVGLTRLSVSSLASNNVCDQLRSEVYLRSACSTFETCPANKRRPKGPAVHWEGLPPPPRPLLKDVEVRVIHHTQNQSMDTSAKQFIPSGTLASDGVICRVGPESRRVSMVHG